MSSSRRLMTLCQLGPRTKPKVVHQNRLWLYTGEEVPTWIGVDQQSGNVDETQTSTAADVPVPSNSIRASVSPPEETKTKTTESTSRYSQRSEGSRTGMEFSIVARDVQILKGEQCNKMALINLLFIMYFTNWINCHMTESPDKRDRLELYDCLSFLADN